MSGTEDTLLCNDYKVSGESNAKYCHKQPGAWKVESCSIQRKKAAKPAEKTHLIRQEGQRDAQYALQVRAEEASRQDSRRWDC